MLELPKKELLRVDEVANFFSVTDRCIRLWIEHGHLTAEKIVGSIRITRDSVLRCRFAKQVVNEVPEEEKNEPEPEINPAPAKRGRPSSRR